VRQAIYAMVAAAARDESSEKNPYEPPKGGDEAGEQPGHEPDAKPIDKHPDGTPMTQDEIDTYWLRHVYKPHVPQLTPRAVITGMLLGGLMSLSNLYVGLKTGWGLAVTVTAAVLAFGIFSGLRKVAPYGPFKKDFTSLENNTMASAASAAGYFTGAGLTSGIPALFMSQGIIIPPLQLALWILAVSFLGVMLAVPMRRQMIDVDRLPFPEGIAYAETIRSLHAAPGEARKKALALFYGASAAGLMKILTGVLGITGGPQLKEPLLPEQIGEHWSWNKRWVGLTLSLQTDILMIGAGAMMGVRISLGLLMGAFIGWGALAMWLHSHGLAGPEPVRATVATWTVWPGVAIIVVNGLLAFGLKWRTAVAAISGLGKLARGTTEVAKAGGSGAGPNDRPKTMAEVEVPAKWFLGGTAACIAFIVVLAYAFFQIPMWMGFLAAVLSILLSIVACRATGETSITPIGALGKITQFMYGGLAAGNVQTNLMTASITAGSAMHSADLLTDMKGGYVLGSKPRSQFLSQFFGIVAGAFFCIPVYTLLATPDRLGTAQFPAPAAQTWRAVADLLAGGINREVRGVSDGEAATAPGTTLNVLPVGTVPGDEIDVTRGTESIGKFKVIDVIAKEKTLLLDRPLPEPAKDAEGHPEPFGVSLRGQAVKGNAKTLKAIRLAQPPEVVRGGDYLKTEVEGRDLWWLVKGRAGDLVVVDRDFVNPTVTKVTTTVTKDEHGASVSVEKEEQMKLTGPLKFEIRKESLPPYAIFAVIIASLVAVILTLLETYLPKKHKKYVPSAAGIGLGFVVSGFDCISMFIGAIIAWYIERRNKDWAEKYTLAGASGIMAGASLVGVLLIFLSQVVGIIATP
jgi:OPT family oligopeptide transporter